MIGVIVKDGVNIVSKDVYGGDDTESLKIVAQKAEESKNLTFEVHADTDTDWKTAFEDVSVSTTTTPEQTKWQTEKAKGTNEAISYLAAKLGLE